MFKELLIVLSKQICDCPGNSELTYSINTCSHGLQLHCTKCKKVLKVPTKELNVCVRIIPVVEGGAKIISFEEAKKKKEENGIVDGIVD